MRGRGDLHTARQGTRAGRTRLSPVVIATLLAACGGSSWTQDAQDYADAHLEANGVGFTNTAAFYAADLQQDSRWFGYVGEGRAPYLQHARDHYQFQDHDPTDANAITRDSPIYLSATGAVQPVWVHVEYPFRFLWRQEFSGGEIANEVEVESAWMLNSYGGPFRSQTDALADRYVKPWAAGDAQEVSSLYAPGATLSDSLTGDTAVGPAQIAAAARLPAERGGLQGAVLHELTEGGGTAAYFSLRGGDDGTGDPEHFHQMVLLLALPGECPGSVAAAVEFDDDMRIVAEQRYHRIDDVERCMSGGDRPEVWWDSITVPDPRAFTRNGAMATPKGEIALWNATPQRESLLRWALEQFSARVILPPTPTSVTFAPFSGDPWSEYGFIPGAPDLVLPASAAGCADRGCDTWPTAERVAALDALARFWVGDVRWATQRDYASAVGLPWEDPEAEPDDPYPLPGPAAQRASDTLVWGLMDEPYPMPPSIAGLPCSRLMADFLLLTQADTPAAACTEQNPR